MFALYYEKGFTKIMIQKSYDKNYLEIVMKWDIGQTVKMWHCHCSRNGFNSRISRYKMAVEHA